MPRTFPDRLRLAGLAALVGGGIQVLAMVVRLLDLAFPSLFEGSGSGVVTVLSLGSWPTLAGVLLVGLGLIGLYVRQAAEGAGIVGLAGFVLALLGNELVTGNYLAVLFADLGWALFGVGSLRARIYPRAASVLLIVSALLLQVFNPSVEVSLGANYPYVGAVVAMGLFGAIAWMGYSLFRERGEEAGRVGGAAEEAQASPRPSSSSPDLFWLGGLATVVGALLVVLFGLTQLVNLLRPDPGASTGGFDQAEVTIMYAQQLSAVIGGALVGLGLVALYLRQSEATPQGSWGVRLLALVGFLLAFGGAFFALDVEDVNWAARLVTNAGWILFGTACLLLTPRVYPRLALVLLIITALIGGVLLNPLVVNLVVGTDTASSLLYVGPGAYPLAYTSTGIDIVFNAVVAWLGFSLLRRSRRGAGTSARRLPRLRGAGDGSSGRLSFTRPLGGLLTAAVLVLGLLPIVLTTGIFGGRPAALDAAQAQSTATDPSCPSADQATYGAYSSSRLVLHNPCQHVVATVQDVEGGESDGDLDIYVNADPEYASLSGTPQNIDNLRRFSNGGNFETELMPRDATHIPEPRVGDKVDVWGAYVFDSQHGYYEIHPIFKMASSSDGGQTWGETYTSGPQYGGPPRRASNANAFAQCRDQNGNPCKGYYNPTSE